MKQHLQMNHAVQISMNPFLIMILVILIGDYLLNGVVDFLNMRHVSTNLPTEFVGYYDQKTYRKSQEYLKETEWFGLLANSITAPLTIAFILVAGFDRVDHLARSFHLGSISTGLIFAGVLLFLYQMGSIPFSIYRTFVIEEKYGFNKTTPKTFVLDILKTWILAAVIGSVLFCAVLWFFEKAGPWAWFYCWMAITLLQIGIIFIAPVLIMPIFNKFVPLPDGELRRAIEAYARSQDFELKGIFTMDGSKRSTKANAFFTGFGRFKRIVLFDTLVEKHSIDELVSVLAHEVGHYKKKHIIKSMAVSFLTSGLMFFVLSLFINNPRLFEAFRMDHVSIYASLFLFGFLYAPIEMIFSVFGNLLSRRHEYDADAFAVDTFQRPQSMISALKKLSVDTLSSLTPHPLKVFLSYGHPPVLERIRAIQGRTRHWKIDNPTQAGY